MTMLICIKKRLQITIYGKDLPLKQHNGLVSVLSLSGDMERAVKPKTMNVFNNE